jgi:hypothetical protein
VQEIFMNVRFFSFILVAAAFVFSACSDDDNGGPVTPSTRISVTNMVPIAGPIGTVVSIRGTNFGTDPEELNIVFGGENIAPLSVTDTEIKVMVPASLSIGPSSIKLSRSGGAEVTVQFTVQDPVVGVWTSEGDDVAPLLYGPPFNIRKIVATLKADASYLMVQTDSTETVANLTGSYDTDAGNAPAPNDRIRTITIYQASPTSVTYEGIYEVTVDGTDVTMKLETIQTDPPLPGISKPTPEEGFGSTGGGQYGTINVQNYVKTK